MLIKSRMRALRLSSAASCWEAAAAAEMSATLLDGVCCGDVVPATLSNIG